MDFTKIINLLKNHTKNTKINILIGIPAFGGMVYSTFTTCCLSLQRILDQCGIESQFYFLNGESLIPRARNNIISHFHHNRQYTHLLFLDSDLQFHPINIIELIINDFELSGLSYPKKSINWKKVKKHSDLIEKDMGLFNSKITDMNYNPVIYMKDGKPTMRVIRKNVEVKDIPTGSMMIKRVVVDLLVLNYPERKYCNNVAGYGNENQYDFFPTGIVDNIYLSEDYYFCKLCKDIGIESYINPHATLIHTGKYEYHGSLIHSLKGDELNCDMEVVRQNLKNF